jgi:PAS domain S-box-containing protein
MTPEQFLLLGNLFSEAALLLNRKGEILAVNRHGKSIGLEPSQVVGRPLADFVATSPHDLENLLRACARSREPILSSLTLRDATGAATTYRCDGALVDRDEATGEAQLVLKLTPREKGLGQFSALNQKIHELSEEIRRRVDAERDLYDQREALRITLLSIGDGVIVTDKQGRVTFLNPIAESLTGWPLDEADGQPLESVFHIVNEYTREPAANPALRALNDGCVIGLANHTILIARDGVEHAIDDSAAPICNAHGATVGAVLVFRDVTETRHLEKVRSRLAALVESSDDAIIGKTFESVVTTWNRGAERLFGFTAEETLGRPLYETIVPPDRKTELLAVLERVRQGEAVDHFQTERVNKQGRRIPISLRVSPIRNAEGEIVEASAIERDISHQKRTEATLRFLADASESLAALIDYKSTLQKVARLAVPDFADWCAIDTVEADGTLQRLAMAHVDPNKIQVAEKLLEHYPEDPTAAMGVAHVLRTGKSERVAEITPAMVDAAAQNEEHKRLIQELGLQSYMCAPLVTRGRTLGAITFASAESSRHYTDEDLAVAEDLAHRASIAIENARLFQQVRDTDRRKDEFLAMLAHELRNPLAPIRSGLDFLAVSQSVDLETIQLMQEQVDHLVRLVDDLLDVSRIIRGRIELRREPVELSTILRRAAASVRPLMESQQQHFTVFVPDRPIWLSADPVRLVQVVGNLLHNAAKYTARGGQIELAAHRDGQDAVLSVRDNGMGIEPELLHRVFDLFTQGSRSLDRSTGGLGIGLTLVRSLVEMHGGQVLAASEGPGHGSEFTVRLPILQSQPGTKPRDPAPSPKTRRKVLVVDDNVSAAQMLAMLLTTLGSHEVQIAHDGVAALKILESYRPEIVLLDIGLPGMDGYQIGREIRKHPELERVLLVAVTGYGQDEDRRRSRDAGFDEHLVKPPSLEHIQSVLVHPKLSHGV